MKLLWQFVRDFYAYSQGKLMLNILLMILCSLTSGIGILMLVPLLAVAGITGETSSNIPFLNIAFSGLGQYSLSVQLLIVLLIYVSLIVSQAAMTRQLSIQNVDIIQGYTRYLRNDLFGKILQADWACLAAKKQTDISNAFTVEISRVSSGAIYLLNICSQFILAVVHLYIAFIMSPVLTVLVLICGILLFFFMNSTLKKSKILGRSLHAMNRELMSRITEQLSSIKESKIYGVEKQQQEVFEGLTGRVENNLNDFARLQSRPDFLYKISAAVIISVFFYFAVSFLKIEPAVMLIILFIFSRLWPLFSSLQNNLQSINVVMPVYESIKQLQQELDEKKENKTSRKYDEITDIFRLEKAVRLENISFRYDEVQQSFGLNNINLLIPAQSITALIGKSGAGKSTLVDLLLGLLKPDSGNIYVDDRMIDSRTMSAWRKAISYVPQDPFLLNESIRENLLRFNPGASEEEIWEALGMAAAYDFVSQLPEGLETVIGDRGIRLSGGERQRIVLARALIRKPQLLVLDEATSALDMENESKIQQAIETMRGRLTIIIIAHRLATIHHADKIVVVDAGQIIETGTYEELAYTQDSWFKRMLDN